MITNDQLQQLRDVNDEVNSIPFDVTPNEDEPFDIWKHSPDGGTFVCRDYVVRKSRLLREMGWSWEALTVVECYTEPPDSVYHAVLCVEVDDECWILDNRFPEVYRKDLPPRPYRWDRRQIAGTTRFESIA